MSLVASILFFRSYGDRRDLPSFPTRRSSDLRNPSRSSSRRRAPRERAPPAPRRARAPGGDAPSLRRSEEHTSELQSRENLVCRLLLEKKKTTTTTISKEIRVITGENEKEIQR